MDDYLRRLERQAAYGDYVSRRLWKAALEQAGIPDPDLEELLAQPTEEEVAQAGYDEQWWHGNTPRKCGLWSHSCFHHGDADFRTAVFKAHNDWGHRGWDTKNSKRKTLRTHRSSRRKARNYRLREAPLGKKQEETPHERRRKKRFGGREHRYGREWIQNMETGYYRVVYKFGTPRLDE